MTAAKIDLTDLTTPEALLAAVHQTPAEIPVDAVHCALARAKAVLHLLMSQLDEPDGRCADYILSDALWGAIGNIELAATMLVRTGAEAGHLRLAANG